MSHVSALAIHQFAILKLESVWTVGITPLATFVTDVRRAMKEMPPKGRVMPKMGAESSSHVTVMKVAACPDFASMAPNVTASSMLREGHATSADKEPLDWQQTTRWDALLAGAPG